MERWFEGRHEIVDKEVSTRLTLKKNGLKKNVLYEKKTMRVVKEVNTIIY